MAKEILDSALWERFEEAARLRRRDPVRLLKEFMRERLEVWEDQKLDKQLKKAARLSGRRERFSCLLVSVASPSFSIPTSWLAFILATLPPRRTNRQSVCGAIKEEFN
jgi:hypothetical protein